MWLGTFRVACPALSAALRHRQSWSVSPEGPPEPENRQATNCLRKEMTIFLSFRTFSTHSQILSQSSLTRAFERKWRNIATPTRDAIAARLQKEEQQANPPRREKNKLSRRKAIKKTISCLHVATCDTVQMESNARSPLNPPVSYGKK